MQSWKEEVDEGYEVLHLNKERDDEWRGEKKYKFEKWVTRWWPVNTREQPLQEGALLPPQFIYKNKELGLSYAETRACSSINNL